MEIEVNRVNESILEIKFSEIPSSPLALYWTDKPDTQVYPENFITDKLENTITVQDPLNAKQRIYFILQNANGRKLFAERTLPIEGLNNFRDFGGYTTTDGKQVKWGMLYRSNHLFNLNEQAVNYISHLGINSIIDYRTQNEINKSPNCHVGEKKTYHLDATAQTAELAAQFAASPDNEDKALIESVIQHIPKEMINGDGLQILEQYRQFVVSDKSKSAFKQMIEVLLDSHNAPNIQHCRGGKDRTGYGALLVLSMLGVPKETIVQDYMLTHFNRLERNEIKMAGYRKITQDKNVLDYLLSLIDTQESFIIEVFNTMEEISGSVENYIKNELKFTNNDIKQLRETYLV